MSSSGSGTVINYCSGSGSDFLTSYGSGSTSRKVTVPVPVPQHCFKILSSKFLDSKIPKSFRVAKETRNAGAVYFLWKMTQTGNVVGSKADL